MLRPLALLAAIVPACFLQGPSARAEPRPLAEADAGLRDPSETSALPEDGTVAAQRAHQQRMRGCALEWHARKRAGKTEGQTWKAFNTGCMKR